MSSYLSVVVLPCLNEEEHLAATCGSLGFGTGRRPPPDTALVIVDNGSNDTTLRVAGEIQQSSPIGSVIVETESERGYVPPRRRGNTVAMHMAGERGVSKANLLIVQADADTAYSEGFVDAVAASARQMGLGVLIDARSDHSDDFSVKHHAYIELCNQTDSALEGSLPDQSLDLVVDDKACAYWASDYELWGGHQREYTSQGDEIHSETTRLYIRGRTHGARRALCDDAIAQHSARRVLAEPAYSFATAGFPRERSFKAKWDELYHGPTEIEEFCKETNRSALAMALGFRRAHLVGLFQLLTLHVHLAIEQGDRGIDGNWEVAKCLPKRGMEVARSAPGVLLEDVFNKIDSNAGISKHYDYCSGSKPSR